MALSVNGGFGSKGGGSNPNLLDNGWFTINQRGATSYESVSSDMYTFDRWYIWRVAVSKSNGVVTVSHTNTNSGGFSQRFESGLSDALVGKTVTASVMLSDGTIKSVTGILSDAITYLSVNLTDNISLKVSSGNIRIYCEGVVSDSVSIRAIKLEYGSTSTLALDSAPDYATELLKCQRYYYKMPTGLIGSALARNNTSANVFIMLPTTMRIIPTITIHGTINLSDGVNANPITSFSTIGNGYNTVSCLANSTGLTQFRSYVLAIPSGDTNYLDISADL